MAKPITQNKFIKRCIKKYGSEFDYSKVEYKSAKSKVIIGCKRHGWFECSPWRFLHNLKGCFWCGHEHQGKGKLKTTDQFIKQSQKTFGNFYDYSKSNYIGSNDKIEIICKRHGSFWQKPQNHLSGMGCLKCRNLYTTEDFIRKAKLVHLDFYDYSKVNYIHGRELVEIICPIHGSFQQKAGGHLEGKGCPACNLSKGELAIKKWLIENNIPYEQQKQFDDCVNPKTGYKLRYDFYLPTKNILIEYDGKQHFILSKEWTKETEESFENRQWKDEVKTKYASDKAIKLIRIKYTQWRTVDKILLRELTA